MKKLFSLLTLAIVALVFAAPISVTAPRKVAEPENGVIVKSLTATVIFLNRDAPARTNGNGGFVNIANSASRQIITFFGQVLSPGDPIYFIEIERRKLSGKGR